MLIPSRPGKQACSRIGVSGGDHHSTLRRRVYDEVNNWRPLPVENAPSACRWAGLLLRHPLQQRPGAVGHGLGERDYGARANDAVDREDLPRHPVQVAGVACDDFQQ